ncbi:conserved hypothetical protein [Arthrobacter sp. 9V]|nr:conserved hypothetical protein [Arthrobacter sp. 9V]
MKIVNVGSSFPQNPVAATRDCPAKSSNLGFEVSCVLAAGHEGRHIAANADMVVVEAWGQ